MPTSQERKVFRSGFFTEARFFVIMGGMKTSLKKLSDTKVQITVTLDAEDLKAARPLAIERLSADLALPGFRKGKVPAKLAEQHLRANDIAQMALDIAVRTTVPKAFADEKQTAIMIPRVEVTKYVANESAEYTATADILPDIKLGDYKKLKVKKDTPKVTAKDIDDVLESIATSYAEKAVVKRAAKKGDEVIIDFTGKKDGKPFKGGSAKDHHLQLGSGTFIPGFEDGVVGHEVGDKFDLPLTFPKDYHAKELAGKKVVFEVLLKQVSEIKKPAYDDDFAKKCGPFKNMDELKEDIRKNLTAQNEHKADEKYKDALVEELIKVSKIPAPEVLIDDQVRFIHDDIERNAGAQGMKFEDFLRMNGQTEEEWTKEAKKVAERRVQASLALQIIARDEKITVDDELVSAKVAELREVYKNSKEALENLKKPEVRQDIKNRMTIEKTLNYLVEQNSK